MKVLLIGIGGTYNYGCEAIVRGTVEKLRSLFPEIQVDYASSRVEDDKKRLEGCNVNIISRKNKWAWWNLTRNILDRLSIKNSISTEDLSLIKKYDAVFSIGGDIYTIFDDGSYAKHLVQYGDICEKYGVPYILWGCSVGPFEQNPAILEIFKKHLKNISLIVAREKVTVDYLKSIGIEKNVVFSFDPAFSVPSIKKVEKK
ncbi:MAG: polysaccharide pyruvyl transferase family protein, partial [Bacteroidaceae bacterium]